MTWGKQNTEAEAHEQLRQAACELLVVLPLSSPFLPQCLYLFFIV